ncbi:MAG: fimbrial protein [Yersiniaceae bacterium]|nr:fimbrial protein [Yersiniaceae bacterium]
MTATPACPPLPCGANTLPKPARGRLPFLLGLAGVVLAALLGGRAAWAGECNTLNYTTPYVLQLDRREIDTSHNKAGQILPDAAVFHLSNQFPMECRCEGGSAALYYRSESLLPPGYRDGDQTYFIVNASLQIGVKLGVKGGTPVPAPFDDLSDGGSYACGSDGTYYSPSEEVANHGTLSLYLASGFTGALEIPLTRLMEVYARWGTQGSYGTRPISRISVFGTLVVPQTCRIGDGQVINVNLGQIRSTLLLTPGAMPARYVPQLITLEYACSNIDEAMHLELTLLGEESAALPGVLQTSNPDIGIQVAGADLAPIPINNGRLPLPLTFGAQGQSGRQYLYAWPVNTTGLRPASGAFSASALMEVEIQ